MFGILEDAIGDVGIGFEKETSELPALNVAAGETLALTDVTTPPSIGDVDVTTAETVSETGTGGEIGAAT
jgi:hypothetical protein